MRTAAAHPRDMPLGASIVPPRGLAGPLRHARRARHMLGSIALTAGGLLAGMSVVASLWWPMGFDQGLYNWVGDVVSRGGMQYRDAWDMHGPLVGYLFAVPQLLFGRNPWGVRLLDMAVLAAGAWAVYAIVRPVASRSAARWAVVMLVLAYASLGFNETAQPDGWVGLIGMALMVPLVRERRPSTAFCAVAGFAVGCFAMVKPFFLLFLLVPLFPSLLPKRSGGQRAGAQQLAILGVASALPIVITAIWFVARGAFAEFIEVHLYYTASVYTPVTALEPGARITGLIEYFWRGKVVSVALPAVAVGAWSLWREGHRRFAGTLLIWASIAVACVIMQNKWYGYHWNLLLPTLVVLGAVGFDRLLAAPATVAGRFFAAASVVLIFAHAALRPAAYVTEWGMYALGAQTREAYLARFESNTIQPLHHEEAASYLRPRLGPGDGVAIWGNDAGLLYLLDRPTPFRLAGWVWPVLSAPGTTAYESYRTEYLRSMREARPIYLVVNEAYIASKPSASFEHFPELATHLAAHYRAEVSFGPLRLYRRIAPSA